MEERQRGSNNSSDDGMLSSLAVAAHEMKSPLVVMRQLALLAQQEGVSAAKRRRLLEQMVVLSEKSLRLTSDLTKVSRLEMANVPAEPINAKVLCERIAYDLGPLYREYGKTIRVSRVASSPLVLAHRDYLERIIYNFSDNALYYGDDQGEVELFVRRSLRRGTVRIGVRDYGPALPVELWRAMRRQEAELAGPLASRPQSSGLGVYIARQFAAAIGGTVGVVRHRDGASFYVDVPVSEQLSLV